MFFCDPCRVKNDWPYKLGTSVGNCEVCGKRALCFDVPSSLLPAPEPESVPCNYCGNPATELARGTCYRCNLVEESITNTPPDLLAEILTAVSPESMSEIGIKRCVSWLTSFAKEQSDKGNYDQSDIKQQRDGSVRALAIRDAASQMKNALDQ
jgi:hypothetical protein